MRRLLIVSLKFGSRSMAARAAAIVQAGRDAYSIRNVDVRAAYVKHCLNR